MSDSQRYTYNVKILTMLWVILGCGVAGAWIASVAAGNDEGLIIDSIFTLTPEQATGVYWLCALVAFAGVCMGLYGIYFALTVKRVVTLSATDLSAPPTQYARTNVVIPLSTITKIALSKGRFQRYLHIQYGTGRIRIRSSLFENRAAFERFLAALHAHFAP